MIILLNLNMFSSARNKLVKIARILLEVMTEKLSVSSAKWMQFHACLSTSVERKKWTKPKLLLKQGYSELHAFIVTTRLDFGQSLYYAMFNWQKNKAKTPPLCHVSLYFLSVAAANVFGILEFMGSFEENLTCKYLNRRVKRIGK